MDTEAIKAFFDQDAFAKTSGAVIERIGDDEVVCTLTIEDRHLNAAGIVQGGAIFTLADFAFAVASNLDDLINDTQAINVGQSTNIHFFKPAKGQKLIAKAIPLQKGRKLSVYRVTLTDDLGTNIAEMSGVAYRMTKVG